MPNADMSAPMTQGIMTHWNTADTRGNAPFFYLPNTHQTGTAAAGLQSYNMSFINKVNYYER